MKSFRNDYCVLAHPRILEALLRYQSEQNEAYGLDVHSKNAAARIGEVFGCQGAPVYFLGGGTQTNMALISAALKPYEAVIAVEGGHINVHETGAVEGSGHKVLTVPDVEGKITCEAIEKVLALHGDNRHMVKPKMVYISNSTEIGTVYKKDELKAISALCKAKGLFLFMDGARLGAALTSKDSDLEPSSIGGLVDAFYVGGTKNGLLSGEALVIVNPEIAEGFEYHVKNKGALLAKGFALGIQFEEAFRDGLYFALAKKSNELGEHLFDGFKALGLDVLPAPTNQVFVTLPKDLANALIARYGCEIWEDKGEKLKIRFVTHFLTEGEDVEELLTFLKNNL